MSFSRHVEKNVIVVKVDAAYFCENLDDFFFKSKQASKENKNNEIRERIIVSYYLRWLTSRFCGEHKLC